MKCLYRAVELGDMLLHKLHGHNSHISHYNQYTGFRSLSELGSYEMYGMTFSYLSKQELILSVNVYTKYIPIDEVYYLPRYEYVNGEIYTSYTDSRVCRVLKIMCNYGNNDMTEKTLLMYSIDRSLIKETLKIAYWKELELLHKQEYDFDIIDEYK